MMQGHLWRAGKHKPKFWLSYRATLILSCILYLSLMEAHSQKFLLEEKHLYSSAKCCFLAKLLPELHVSTDLYESDDE